MSDTTTTALNVTFNIQAPPLAINMLQTGLSVITQMKKELDIMSQELNDLTTAVTAISSTVDSAVTLINGIAARISAAGVDPTALSNLTTELTTESANLAAAVAANTPAPDPVVAPTP